MGDDLADLKKEVARLRHDVDEILQTLREERGEPEQNRFVPLETGVLSIRHGTETPAIVLKAEEGEVAIYLNDSAGRARGLFQVDEEGARFEIWNKEQQAVISIGESKDGTGEIYVAGADGKPRAGLKVTHAGGVVSAQNPDAHINALMIGKVDGGTIIVADADGRPLVEIAANKGGGTVAVKQASGTQAAALTSDENGGALAVFDDEGKPRQTLAEKLSSLSDRITRKMREPAED